LLMRNRIEDAITETVWYKSSLYGKQSAAILITADG